MNEKPYELGILVGRFQTFHTGHEMMIRKAIQLCGRVGVLIGSSQESGTEKNPFSYEIREGLLKKVFGDSIEVRPLPDIGVGNNSAWGDYVLSRVQAEFGRNPDLLISGKESRRVSWFDSLDGLSISELYIPKVIDISASLMREFFIADRREDWVRYTPDALHDEYDRLREIVLSASGNTATASL